MPVQPTQTYGQKRNLETIAALQKELATSSATIKTLQDQLLKMQTQKSPEENTKVGAGNTDAKLAVSSAKAADTSDMVQVEIINPFRHQYDRTIKDAKEINPDDPWSIEGVEKYPTSYIRPKPKRDARTLITTELEYNALKRPTTELWWSNLIQNCRNRYKQRFWGNSGRYKHPLMQKTTAGKTDRTLDPTSVYEVFRILLDQI